MIEALNKKKCLLEYIKSSTPDGEQKEQRKEEDAKTSSILGTLSLLPFRLFKTILGYAVSSCIDGTITGIEFWPHWKYRDPNDSTREFVEPDVVLKLEGNKAIIIEAKRDSSTLQDENQWQREINAGCDNGYEIMSLVALDGNRDFEYERKCDIDVYKTSWPLLLNAVCKIREQLKNGECCCYFSILKLDVSIRREIIDGWIRILNQTINAFAIFGYYPTQFMADTIPAINISKQATDFFNQTKYIK